MLNNSLQCPPELPMDILETISRYYAEIHHGLHRNHLLIISSVFTNAMRRNVFAYLTVDPWVPGGLPAIIQRLQAFLELADSSARMDGLSPISRMVKTVDLTLAAATTYVTENPATIDLLVRIAKGVFPISRFVLHFTTLSGNRPFKSLSPFFQQHLIDVFHSRHLRHISLAHVKELPRTALLSPHLEVMELTAVSFSDVDSERFEASCWDTEPTLLSLSLRRTAIPFPISSRGTRNGVEFYRKLRHLQFDEADLPHLQGILDQNDGSLSSLSIRVKGPIFRGSSSSWCLSVLRNLTYHHQIMPPSTRQCCSISDVFPASLHSISR